MKCKIIAIALAFVLVATLSFASGKKGEVETKTGKGGTVYGGVLNLAHPFDPEGFDQAYRSAHRNWSQDVTNEVTIAPDWTKGPAGTGKLKMNHNIWPPSEDDWVGLLCESWDLTDPLRWVLKVRPGVQFQNKPPVNGREVTAEDVRVSYERGLNMEGSWASRQPNKPTSITAPDKYTVVMEFEKYNAEMDFVLFPHFYVIAKESVWDENENETEGLRDWRNALGTGPWMLTDYVEGSYLEYERSDNYWHTDPFPERAGNKLPYIDGLKVRIIEDEATRVAAIRAGQIDATSGGSARAWVDWVSATELRKTSPELKWVEHPVDGIRLQPNTIVEPFNDQRVRQALSMGIDRNALIDDLYKGNAPYLVWWAPPEAADEHVPFDKLPSHIKETHSYNPEKAKKLLAEAGYPNGFETQVLCTPDMQDLSLYIADQWKKIGVDLKVDVREQAVVADIHYAKSYQGIYTNHYWEGSNMHHMLIHNVTDWYGDPGNVNDPYYDKEVERILSILDKNERAEATKKAGLYIMEQMWVIPVPAPSVYTFWQPYLKGFEGGFKSKQYGYYRHFVYTWLDK